MWTDPMKMPGPSPERELKRRELVAKHKAVIEELEAAALVVLPFDCLQRKQLEALLEWHTEMAAAWAVEADMLRAEGAMRFGPGLTKP